MRLGLCLAQRIPESLGPHTMNVWGKNECFPCPQPQLHLWLLSLPSRLRSMWPPRLCTNRSLLLGSPSPWNRCPALIREANICTVLRTVPDTFGPCTGGWVWLLPQSPLTRCAGYCPKLDRILFQWLVYLFVSSVTNRLLARGYHILYLCSHSN